MTIDWKQNLMAGRERVRLTGRELEVLCLIGQGASSEDTADALYLSKRTVGFHLANIYQKLGVRNRIQAILAAGRMGLIPIETAFGIVPEMLGALNQDQISSRPVHRREYASASGMSVMQGGKELG